MRVIYISNFMNHHILPFCNNLYSESGMSFSFIAISGTPRERLALGYEDLNDSVAYVTKLTDDNRAELMQRCFDCDILLVGSAEDVWFIRRLRAGKTVVKISERFFKNNSSLTDKLRNICSGLYHITRFQNKNIFYLCCSSYTKDDLKRFSRRRDNIYKWGYFPARSADGLDSLMARKKPRSIVWAARFIDWKHPEAVLYLAKQLKNAGCCFSITMIGNGDMFDSIARQVEEQGLSDVLTLTGGISTAAVREYMESAEIFVMTSDRKEGWGAVLNEAMSSACAVVADFHAGAVGYLVREGDNGLTYGGGFDELADKVKRLLDDPVLRRNMARNAFDTISGEWDPDVASQRLYKWLCSLYRGETCDMYQTGPCSRDGE